MTFFVMMRLRLTDKQRNGTLEVKHYKQLLPNMGLQIENERSSMRHFWGVYEQNSIVNSVCVDDWTAKRVISFGNEHL